MDLSEQAVEYIRSHRKDLINVFADKTKFFPVDNPFTIFMAGSPGAGKTEFSRLFNPGIYNYDCKNIPIVRIDADEIRNMFKKIGYDGTNATIFQKAATIGVEKLFDYVNHNDQNVILDTTFSDFEKAKQNVERSIMHKRKIGIFYIHLEPKTAWAYTKVREKTEGRRVSLEFFIDAYFSAKETVNKIKNLYPQIELNVVDKVETSDIKQPIKSTSRQNVLNIDDFIKLKYNREQLLINLKL